MMIATILEAIMMGWKAVKSKLPEIKTLEEMEKIVNSQQKLISILQRQINILTEHVFEQTNVLEKQIAVLARACHIEL